MIDSGAARSVRHQTRSDPGQPLVTVLIAAGRQPEVLARCLDSLLAQDAPPPFELVVGAADDGLIKQTVAEKFPDTVVA